MEDPGPDPVERGRWHVRQAMARAVALQYLSTGEAQRLVAAMRAYQQADRRLLERLGRNPGPEELAQELGKPVTEVLALGNMVRDAAAAPKESREPAQEVEKVEDTAYFQLRTRVEELLSVLEEVDQALLKGALWPGWPAANEPGGDSPGPGLGPGGGSGAGAAGHAGSAVSKRLISKGNVTYMMHCLPMGALQNAQKFCVSEKQGKNEANRSASKKEVGRFTCVLDALCIKMGNGRCFRFRKKFETCG